MLYLVTGAGGFLGRYIAEQLLERGDRVRGFARGKYPELTKLGVEMVTADIRDANQVTKACRGVDAVFHVAAVAGVWGNWHHYYQINTVGTQNVVAGCHEHHVSKLIFSSSPSVTFDGTDQCGVDEQSPYATTWLCHYPHSKALAEQHILEAHGTDGLATCALRPHLIWGPRDRHLIPRVVERARKGALRQVGDGTNVVDMIYVENAAHAHLQAADALSLESPVGGKPYFLSQGTPVNCWGWINEILALYGLPKLRKSISYRMAWRLGHALEQGHRLLRIEREPRMTRFVAAQLATSHYFDISAARRDFGYAPKISTEEGMARLAAAVK